MSSLRLKLLGGFDARLSSGETVNVASRKGQVLLALLALRAGEALAREKLVGLLWSDRGETQARGSLRQELTILRKILRMVEPAPIVIESEQLRLEPSSVEVDVVHFEKLVRSEVTADLERAVELYSGPFLGELMVKDSACAEWLYHERERLRSLVLGGLDRLLERRIREGALDQAVGLAEAILSHDPVREDIHRRLMDLYARQGRYANALKQYQTCRQILGAELSVEPEPATTRLYHEIKERRVMLALSRSETTGETVAPEPGAAGPHHEIKERRVTPALSRSESPDEPAPFGEQAPSVPTDILVSRNATDGSNFGADSRQLYEMGRSFFLRNIWGRRALEVARQLFVQAIEIDPSCARAYAGVANCDSYRSLLGNPSVSFDEIMINCARALEIEPDLPEALTAKGLALYAHGRYELAEAFFERAAALAPNQFECHYFRGRNYRILGLHEKAAAQFERAASLNNMDFRSLGLLVDEYKALGRTRDSQAAARSCLERLKVAVTTQAPDGQTLSFGALILAEMGDRNEAAKWLVRADKADPSDPIAIYNAACANAQLGCPEIAVEKLEACLRSPEINRAIFVDWIRNDTSLDPLRPNASFQKLIEMSSKNAEADGTRGYLSSTKRSDGRAAIAVLPLTNIGGDPEKEFFADGLTEDLITDLSKISALSVVSRSAVNPHRRPTANLGDIARALSVRYVLEGAIRATEKQISVTAKLVDASSGICLWAERFDRDIDDFLTAQHEISQRIVQTLKIRLLPAEAASFGKVQSTNTDAYRQCVLGRSYFLLRGGGIVGLRVAKQAYEKAAQLDPSYARAYAGMANSDALRVWRGDTTVSVEEVLANAGRALQLDPTLAESHCAVGLSLYLDGRHAEAHDALNEAVRLGPNLFEAHMFSGRNCYVLGRYSDAAEHFERASDLEPGHYRAPGLAASVYRSLGQYAEMKSAAKRGIERCMAEVAVHPQNIDAITFCTAVLAECGYIDRAREWIMMAEKLNPVDSVSNYNLATSYARLGNFDQAMVRLKKVFSNPLPTAQVHLDWLRHEDAFDMIRDRQDFIDLMSQIEGKRQSKPSVDPRPAIAILPFDNLSERHERQHVVDALAEEITAALSRVPSFFVTSRGSTFRYRGCDADPSVIGGELGVRYLLRGNVQTSEQRLRISVRLVEVPSGTTIWAERFERSSDHIFDVLDEITERVVGAIQPSIRIAEIERAKRKRPESLEAYDLVMRALPKLLEMTDEASAEVIRLCEQAISLDPGYARAYALSAWCYSWRIGNDWSQPREFEASEGIRMARKALQLGGNDPSVLIKVSTAEATILEDIETAEIHIRKAMQIDPNNAWGWIRSGYIQVCLGNHEVALQHFMRAERLSPFDPLNFNRYVGMGMAHFFLRHYEEALALANKALAERPHLPWGYRVLAASQQMLGNYKIAAQAAKSLMKLSPSISIATIRSSLPTLKERDFQHFAQALKAAGIPEVGGSQKPVAVLPNQSRVS